MDENIKLKPCQFCGAEMVITSEFYPADEPDDVDTTYYDYMHKEVPKAVCPLFEYEKLGDNPIYTDRNIKELLKVVSE